MAVQLWRICYLVFPAIILFNLYKAPYTKVEESFNIQAIHDILHYGVPLENAALKFQALFDHITFRGAVPRTFVGALLISGLAKPFIWLGSFTGYAQQFCVRATLGLLNAAALIAFTRSTAKAYGPTTALWLTLIQASQFHIMFYASRTLPNMFAFCLSTFALAALLPNPQSSLGAAKRSRLAFYLLTLATVIFRSELALLIGSHGLYMLSKSPDLPSRVHLVRAVFFPAIVAAALVGILITVSIDTYFWQSPKLLWPELEAFLSNVFPTGDDLGASAWGTSPWHWYFTSALPRIFMFNFPLLLVSPVWNRDWRALDHLVPSMLYTALYSILPHKETRFLFPVIPSLSLYLALVITRLENASRNYNWLKLFLYASLFTTIASSLFSLTILLPMSAVNYPGGLALQQLHLHHHLYGAPSSEQPQIDVHLTNLALQSGVTRFLEQPNPDYSHPINTYASVKSTAKSEPYGYDPDPAFPPLILPGSPDGRVKAQTIYHSSNKPQPTPSPQPRTLNLPRWHYDKTSNSTSFLEPLFWSRFNYAVVENNTQAIGAWEIVGVVRGLGRPRIAQPGDEPWMRETLEALYGETTGGALAAINYVTHYALSKRLFGGRWVDWPMVDKLYILQEFDSWSAAKDASGPRKGVDSEEILGLPAGGVDEGGKGARVLGNLGPLVVNRDGTLSRLDNWAGMTEKEKLRTLKYLRERNQLRLEHVAERLEQTE